MAAPPVHLVPTLLGAVAVLAATLAIPPMISGGDWFWRTVEVVMVIWLVGVGARLARVPAPAAVLLQIAGAAIALTALFTVGGIGGVIPNGAVLSEAGELLTGAWSQIRTTVSPAPVSVELSFLICLAVGTTALIVDILIAVCRAPALVALPLLCVYSVPASIDLTMLPWEAFAAPAMLYALLLVASGLSGRRVGAGAGLAQVVSGVALAAVATVIALLVANSVTGVGTAGRLPRTSDGQSTGIGLSPFTTLQGNLTRSEPVTMLEVRGLTEPHYLRTIGLEQWTDGRGFSIDELADGPLPAQAPEPGEQTVTVDAISYRDEFLPIYNGTSALEGVDTSWSYDEELESVHREDSVTPSQYQVSVSFITPTADQLRADSTSAGGILAETGDLAPEVISKAQEVAANAQTSFDKADALLKYFTDPANGFTYSLDVPVGPTDDPLVNFLDNQRGYCEQYATAMAIMLRAVGVPARVAIGFTQGSRVADGSYQISSNDAHAWVEVPFESSGWVEFDPTPLGNGLGGQQGFEDTGPAQPTTLTTISSLAGQTGDDSIPTEVAGGASAPSSTGATSAGGANDEPAIPAALWWVLAGLILVIAAAAGPNVVRGRRRTARLAQADAGGPEAAAAAWREIEDLAIDHGLGLDQAESARATANRVAKAAHLPEKARSDLRTLVTQVERGWYGDSGIAPGNGAVDVVAVQAVDPAVGAAPRALAIELQHRIPLSALERLVPRSVRPSWWRY